MVSLNFGCFVHIGFLGRVALLGGARVEDGNIVQTVYEIDMVFN